jgi:hypothetical protein
VPSPRRSRTAIVAAAFLDHRPCVHARPSPAAACGFRGVERFEHLCAYRLRHAANRCRTAPARVRTHRLRVFALTMKCPAAFRHRSQRAAICGRCTGSSRKNQRQAEITRSKNQFELQGGTNWSRFLGYYRTGILGPRDSPSAQTGSGAARARRPGAKLGNWDSAKAKHPESPSPAPNSWRNIGCSSRKASRIRTPPAG